MQNMIREALSSADLKFQTLGQNEHQTVYKLGMQLENGRTDTFIDIRPNEDQVIIQTALPNNIPENHRDRMANFLTRANHGLIIGNFEMDYSDGQVKYKVTYLYDSTIPKSGMVFLRNLFTSFNMMDRYLPGIMSVIYANVTPENAIHQIENSTNPSMN